MENSGVSTRKLPSDVCAQEDGFDIVDPIGGADTAGPQLPQKRLIFSSHPLSDRNTKRLYKKFETFPQRETKQWMKR